MNRILITGSSGALGKSLMDRLRDMPAVATLGTTRALLTESRADTVACNLNDENDLKQLIDRYKPTCIFHLAASFSDDVEICLTLNVQVPLRILRIVEQSRSNCRVVLIGSAAEYGLINPDENPVSEMQPLRPVSAYGYSKACQSHLLSLFSTRGVDVVCARVFNLWGAEMSDRLFVGRIQTQIREILGGKRSTLEIGSLDAYRDYISVTDACNLLLRIARYGLSGQTYHVGSGEPIQMRSLLEKMLNQYGLGMSCVNDAKRFSNRSGYDVPIIFANMAKSLQLPTV